MKEMNREEEEMIEAYLDNNLPKEKQSQVEQKIKGNPVFQDYVDFLKKIKQISKDALIGTEPQDLTDQILARVFTPHALALLRWKLVTVTSLACLVVGI